MKKFLSLLMAAALTIPMACTVSVSAADESTPQVLAHWKLQEEYCTGSVDDDNLTFEDLSGNGNTLVTATEGNGDQLDIFTWAEGCDISSASGKTALHFGNTLAAAQSVDPYTSAETEYNGAYTSGKYLETVEDAPLNSMTFVDQPWSIEIVFKISNEYNTNYNRYVGLFSRQGVVEGLDEPPLSLALTELVSGGTDDGSLLGGTTGLQYVHIDADMMKTNQEYANGDIVSDQWIHFLATSDGEGLTEVYIDGENVATFGESSSIYCTDPTYSWEVGVGRKSGTGKNTKNTIYPEGLIRRLFCGDISEIRVTNIYMEDGVDSLFYRAEPTQITNASAETTDTATEAVATAETIAETAVEAVEEAVTETAGELQSAAEATTEILESGTDLSETAVQEAEQPLEEPAETAAEAIEQEADSAVEALEEKAADEIKAAEKSGVSGVAIAVIIIAVVVVIAAVAVIVIKKKKK